MLLAIDAGNTNIVLGLFQKDKLLGSWRLTTQSYQTPDELGLIIRRLLNVDGGYAEQITAVVLSSVVPSIVRPLREMAQRYFKLEPLVVGVELDLGLEIDYDNPSEVGADRLVNAVAAWELYGKQPTSRSPEGSLPRGGPSGSKPLVLVDFGTAITFCVISIDGKYLGGIIFPGGPLLSQSLWQHTAKLPRVELKKPPSAIGRTTINSIQSGLFFGIASVVDGMIGRIEEELQQRVSVVATGGLAEIIASECRRIEHINSELTLQGLRLIYLRNRGAYD